MSVQARPTKNVSENDPFDDFRKPSHPVPSEIQEWGDRFRNLMDPVWIKEQLVTKTEKEIAKELHVAPKTLRKALKYHRIVVNLRSSKRI